MFKRALESVLLERAARYPVVTVTGPRQSGKTTLVRHAFPDHRYVSLELPDVRQRAVEDPRGLMAEIGDNPVILDEVQRVPEILSYIQVSVDENARPGRFILTGSQNLQLMESVSQTLAGRTAVLHLFPLTVSERFARPLLKPEQLIENDVDPPPPLPLWQVVWEGLYPRIHDRAIPPQEWLADYYRTYVERDLREVLRVTDLDTYQRFVRLAASHTGQELNASSLASDVGVSVPTATRWLTTLKIGFLAMTLPPHHRNFRKRIRKRPRLHFIDSGLVCYLLGIRSPEQLANHPLRGAIFESFIAAELAKAFENAGRDAALFHWRDVRGHEIDILIDSGDELIPVEVKSGMSVSSDAVDNLVWWCGLGGNPARSGVLVHGGTECFHLKGIRVRPWYLR